MIYMEYGKFLVRFNQGFIGGLLENSWYKIQMWLQKEIGFYCNCTYEMSEANFKNKFVPLCPTIFLSFFEQNEAQSFWIRKSQMQL